MSKSKYDNILKNVLRKIRPKKSEEKKLKALANKVIEVSRIEAAKVNAKPLLVGSLTRDTWLPDKTEFDVFILFPPDLPRKEFEKKGLEVGKRVIKKLRGKFKIEYAEHPYVCGKVRGVDIDIVPCYDIKSADELKCAVDRTPFHVKYIDKNLSLKKSGEVRLLKQFCKANGVYGADAKMEGFSGYVCELLIVKYGSFLATAKALAEFNAGVIIDIEKFYDKKDFQVLRRKFKNQAMILIDPIDKKRNASAAVSARSLYKIKKSAKQFLSRPSTKQFFKKKYKPISKTGLLCECKHRGTEIILISFKPPKVVPDILWPQLRKFADRLEDILKENEFSVLRKDVYTDEDKLAAVLLEMEVSELPSVQKRIGPTVFAWENSKRFLGKYSKMALTGPFVEDNFWVVEVKRKFLTAKEKLKDSLRDKEKILKAKGIPSHIAKQISKKYAMTSEPKKIMKLAKDKEFGIFLRKYFEMENLS